MGVRDGGFIWNVTKCDRWIASPSAKCPVPAEVFLYWISTDDLNVGTPLGSWVLGGTWVPWGSGLGTPDGAPW